MTTLFLIVGAIGISLIAVAVIIDQQAERERRRILREHFESYARFHSDDTLAQIERTDRLDRARRAAQQQRKDMIQWHDE